ncbi:ankyrin repeat domain-containing protein [Wolbachia endosymbiont of Armadillidium arcangelii]|uniref:Ankyrin repeat domain-containing protein n=1 Tax=Wolbachia endosymbiont of Armadillidium arcangelii TaxID=3158571 RepID=A0AAU7Q3Q5_9RICK
MIDLLLGKRADVNVKDKKGDTPLHVAVMTSNLFTDEMSDFLDMVRKLLDKGAKIYTRNKGSFTPLGLVKRGSDLEMFFLITKTILVVRYCIMLLLIMTQN